MSAKSDSARFWLSRGFSILPCQPGQKALVPGYGIFKAKITNEKTAAQWFEASGANIAVLAPDGFFILDFDDLDLYAQWVKQCPAEARSYTETTPNGGTHVFMQGTPPKGVRLKKGAEIKRVVLVSPSIIDGKTYKCVSDPKILNVDPVAVLSSLSEEGHATPYFLQASQTRQPVDNPLSRVSQIKEHYSIEKVLKLYKPDIALSGRGDWKTCKCPFHRDSKPSFYFSDVVGVWGCHACNVRGDVINLYARFEGVNVREAITRMWAVMA